MTFRRPPALFALVVAAAACLPDLDASLRDNTCIGGAPDGFLQDGEQCDDGNEETGDGCSPACRVECAGVLDPLTFHCFEAITGAMSPTLARDRCRTKGGAGLVTMRDERERTFVLDAMRASGITRVHTAYELAGPTVAELASGPQSFSYAVASPSNLYRSPGLLLASSPVPLRCAGCFPADPMLTFTAAKDRLVFGDSGLEVVGATDVAAAVCERTPVGAPANRCPGVRCTEGAAVDVEIDGARYGLFANPANPADAEATCASVFAGHLLWLTSERERERVVRWFSTAFAGSLVWVGLGEANGAYVWSDGVRDGEGRPSFVTVDLPPLPGTCGALVLQTGSFEVGLVRPMACNGKSTPPKVVAEQAFLCKSLDLNRR